MKKALIALGLTLAMVPFGFGQDKSKAENRLNDSATVLQELTQAAPDKGIPQSIREDAKCVAVVPGMTKAAFGIGGHWGDGVATCRTASGWSAPAFFTITGGSFGFQLGVEKTDLVMMVMNKEGMNELLKGKIQLGAQASAAAGPVGRQASGKVGYKAAILTYSKSKGAFAGASLGGAVLQEDNNLMNAFYPNKVSFSAALTGKVPPPAGAQNFLAAVREAGGTAQNASK
jgi:SH3 domain-containing YSC84-like protein 1